MLQAGRGRSLVETSLDANGNARPEQVFVGARDGAVQNQAPLLLVGVGEAQALEGNRHQNKVASFGEMSLGAPHRVKRGIKSAEVGGAVFATRALGPQLVPLDAQGVRP